MFLSKRLMQRLQPCVMDCKANSQPKSCNERLYRHLLCTIFGQLAQDGYGLVPAQRGSSLPEQALNLRHRCIATVARLYARQPPL